MTEIIRPFAPRTKDIIGRQNEIQAIRALLARTGFPAGKVCVLHITGPGGIGKTRLLEEIKNLPEAERFICGEIVDLYHSENHSPQGIEQAIIRAVDPAGEHFAGYRTQLAQLEERRRQGVPAAELEQERRNLTATFIADFNRLSARRPIILRLDTLELVQYESEIILQVCGVEEEDTILKTWLLDQISQMKNTAVILAGRPKPERVIQDLQAHFAHKGIDYQLIQLDGLTEDQTLAYFEAMAAIQPRIREIPEDARRLLHSYTDGRPVRLSLVIDLALYGDIRGLFPAERDEAVKDIDDRLIENLLDLPSPKRAMLYYLWLARKGLDEALLQQLEPDWTPEECRRNLERMRQFTFVKPRPGAAAIFSHDELYELFDRHLDRQDARRTFEIIIKYYEDKLKAAASEDEQADLKASLLYYRLRLDPRDGFWTFIRWSEEAIKGGDVNLDMRLRDEFLRFMNSMASDTQVARLLPRDETDRDSATRWVKRYLARGRFKDALHSAQCILGSQHPSLRADDPLFRATLLTYYGEALAYTGEGDPVAPLKQAIELLEKVDPGTFPAREQDHVTWLKYRTLGRAHNNLGYTYRRDGKYNLAREEYARAINALRRQDIQDEMADTINNQAYVHSLLSLHDKAEGLIEDALNLRRKLGKKNQIALSLNTRGLIFIAKEHPLWGTQSCAEALQLFQETRDRRGEGMALIALGLAHRRRGNQANLGVYKWEEALGFYSAGQECLEKAIDVFSELNEPVRLWEAYNELGCLHTDRGFAFKQSGKPGDAIIEQLELAIRYLNKSLEIAREHGFIFQQIDTLDDLAQAHADLAWWGYAGYDQADAFSVELEIAQKYIAELRGLVPQDYKLSPNKGFNPVEEPVDVYWQMMGKSHLQEGIWAYRPVEQGKMSDTEKDQAIQAATRQFAIAIAYFQQFSPEAAYLQITYKALYRRFKELKLKRLEQIIKEIEWVGQEYSVNLDRFVDYLKNMLGAV